MTKKADSSFRVVELKYLKNGEIKEKNSKAL